MCSHCFYDINRKRTYFSPINVEKLKILFLDRFGKGLPGVFLDGFLGFPGKPDLGGPGDCKARPVNQRSDGSGATTHQASQRAAARIVAYFRDNFSGFAWSLNDGSAR